MQVDHQIDWTITKYIEAVEHAERAGWGLVMGRHNRFGSRTYSGVSQNVIHFIPFLKIFSH